MPVFRLFVTDLDGCLLRNDGSLPADFDGTWELLRSRGAVLAGVIEPASATPVVIEDDVLIGANAVVIEGVRVGRGAVVAAGAVVIEDVPEDTVVAGCPARAIKKVDAGTSRKTALQESLRNLE